MKLFDALKLIFKGKKSETVTDILTRRDMEEHTTCINNVVYVRLWAVADAGNGFKVRANGFHCKASAKAYAEFCNFDWYIFPYETTVKDSYTE